MKHPNKDFVAEAIADYEAMSEQEQGELLVSVLEDQPLLMGFVTNLADEFTDSEHEALVDSVVILINAFVSAGIPISLIPKQLVDEVIEEKVETYKKKAGEDQLEEETIKEVSDSPIVFEDLRNRALFKSDLSEDDLLARHNFSVALDMVISVIERSAAAEIEKKDGE